LVGQESAEQVADRFSVTTPLALDGLGQKSDQSMSADAFGQFGIRKASRILQRVGDWSIGAEDRSFGLGCSCSCSCSKALWSKSKSKSKNPGLDYDYEQK